MTTVVRYIFKSEGVTPTHAVSYTHLDVYKRQHRDITEKYKEATGQGLQKKATPIREGVIVISEETTIQQLQDLSLIHI